MTRRAIWLPLGLFAAALVGLSGLFASDAQAGGGAANIIVSSTTCTPGQVSVDTDPLAPVVPVGCTVTLTVTPTSGDVGALDVAINYNAAFVTATLSSAPTCNPAFDADTIQCSLADLSGLSGVEATIGFDAVPGADGDVSPLALVITACTDTTGTDNTCTPTDGTITLQAATPTPVPTAVPTAAPTAVPTAVGQTPSPVPGVATATPAGLPPTGSNSGSSALPLFLAAMGIAAVTAGAWAVTRLRRVQA